MIPYSPLAGGFLTGKHRGAARPADGTRFTIGNAAKIYTDRYWHARQFEVVEKIAKLAAGRGS